MMLRYLLIPAALLCAGTASAQSWRVASANGEAPDRVVYVIDEQSIVRNGDTVDYVVQAIYERAGGERRFNRSVVKTRGNCAALQTQILTDAYYDDDRLLTHGDDPGEIRAAAQGSAGWGVLITACGKRDYITQPLPDPVSWIRNFYSKNPGA